MILRISQGLLIGNQPSDRFGIRCGQVGGFPQFAFSFPRFFGQYMPGIRFFGLDFASCRNRKPFGCRSIRFDLWHLPNLPFLVFPSFDHDS